MLIGVIGVSALALEYGHGLLQRTRTSGSPISPPMAGAGLQIDQFNTSASSATSNIVALNGLSQGTASVVSSPTSNGNQAMQVTVTSNVPLLLARGLPESDIAGLRPPTPK